MCAIAGGDDRHFAAAFVVKKLLRTGHARTGQEPFDQETGLWHVRWTSRGHSTVFFSP
jgi:hypothetical protein